MRPSVPETRLREGDWQLATETTETVFELATVRVGGHTLLYEDAALRDAIDRATDLEGPWRFFFATGLTFEPALGAGLGATLIAPTVTAQARRRFVADVHERGFRAVERDRTRWIRTDAGARARCVNYTGEHVVETEDACYVLDIEAWLAVWSHERTFRIAGGAYPVAGLDALLTSVGADATAAPGGVYREELLNLIAAVE